MVIDILAVLIVIAATLAALAGIIVLESFFRNRLKDLFSDSNYFIFFFLVMGYFLYSIGEVSYYLTTEVLGDISTLGIADVYWTCGAVFILLSFMALARSLFKQFFDQVKLTRMLLFGGALIVLVLYLIFGVTLRGEAHFFSYFYPIASALIVAFAFSVVIFSARLEHFDTALLLFFLSSCGILLGDVLFTYVLTHGISGAAGIIGDLFYLFGYGFSFVAFVVLKLKMRSLSV